MTLMERIKGAVAAIGLLILCFPVAVAITFVTSPLWSWLESRSGIEAYGHSGPAEWCYLLVYGILVAVCTWAWARLERRAGDKEAG